MTDAKGSTSTDVNTAAQHKEWDDISCPICMDYPHNAVLLICTSHNKGCRSYICDTSYRHSNCLDRFKKSSLSSQDNHSQLGLSIGGNVDEDQTTLDNVALEPIEGSRMRRNLLEPNEDYHVEENEPLEAQNESRELNLQAEESIVLDFEESGVWDKLKSNHLKCPLCRGTVIGWRIDKEERQYLDLKPRSCSGESCAFSGNYRELRRHARSVHPATRPADVDPSRQRAWRHLEHQQEYRDIVSAIRSATPGALVLGDYVIDGGDPLSQERDLDDGGRAWWTLLLFHIMSSPNGSSDVRRGSSRLRRTRRRSSRNRNLWGENIVDLQDEGDDNDVRILEENEISYTRRRRRFVRARTEELP